MNRKVIIIPFVLVLLSCNSRKVVSNKIDQDNLLKKDLDSINLLINTMSDSDQYYRHLLGFGIGDEAKIDSLRNYYANKQIDLDSLLDRNENLFVNKKYRDSIEIEMLRNDKKNTETLLGILSVYGFPSEKRVPGKKVSPPDIIIQHTPQNYLDSMSKMLKKEYEVSHIDTFEYRMLGWHLAGRPMDYDFPEGINIIKVERGTGKADTINE